MLGICVSGKQFKEYLNDRQFWGEYRVDLTSGHIWIDEIQAPVSDIHIQSTNVIETISDKSAVRLTSVMVQNSCEGKFQYMKNHYEDWFRERKNNGNKSLCIDLALPNNEIVRKEVGELIRKHDRYYTVWKE